MLQLTFIVATREAQRQAVRKIAVAWIELAGSDFAESAALADRMLLFVREVVSETLSLILQSIMEQDKKKTRTFADEFRTELVFTEDRARVQRCCAELITCTPTELADAIAALDRELLGSLNANNYNSTTFSAHFNRLSFGVVSFVLSCTTQEQQYAVMRAMIEVAARLYDLHDMNGLYAIVSGLTAHDLERVPSLLPATALSASHRLTLNQLHTLCSPEDNYSSLRAIQLACLAEGEPVVPFFPTYLRDLVALSETSSDFIAVGKELARLLEFKENIGKTAAPDTRLSRQSVALRKTLLDLPVLTEDSRHALSDAAKAQVVRSKSLTKRGSQILGKSLLGDKGARIRGVAKKNGSDQGSGPGTSPRRRTPENDHLKPRQTSGEEFVAPLPKPTRLSSEATGAAVPSPTGRSRTESDTLKHPVRGNRASLFQSMPSVPMVGNRGSEGGPSRSSSTSNIAEEAEEQETLSVPKSVSVGSFVDISSLTSPRSPRDKACVIS